MMEIINISDLKKLFIFSKLLDFDKINIKSFNKEKLIIKEKFKKKRDVLIIPSLPFINQNKNSVLKQMLFNFGLDPIKSEPCFYNQDWYLNENFFNKSTLNLKWIVVNKKLDKKTLGKNPNNFKPLIKYSAAELTYVFFVYYLLRNKALWKNEFIWTNDFDNFGDRIYVGRYIDKDKFAKNGFSIHRHLSIRKNYGII